MQEPLAIPSLPLSLGEKSRKVPSTTQPGIEGDEAWQGLSGLVGTGENIQGSQLSLETPDLACSQDSVVSGRSPAPGVPLSIRTVSGEWTGPSLLTEATQNTRTHMPA